METLFYRLLLAHFIADFPLQLGKVYELKVKNKYGVLLHSAIVLITSILVSMDLLKSLTVIGVIFLNSAIHFFIDSLKIEIGRKINTNNVYSFLFDQFLHIGIIFILAVLLVPKNMAIPGNNIPVILVIGYVAAAFMGIVLEYAIKQTFNKTDQLYIPMKVQILGIIERTVTVTLIIIPGCFYFLIPIPFVVRFILAIKKRRDFYIIDVITSFVLSLAIGIILRRILL